MKKIKWGKSVIEQNVNYIKAQKEINKLYSDRVKLITKK